MKHSIGVSALALMLPLGGCATAKQCETAGVSVASQAAEEANPTGMALRVIEAGAEPRRALRYVYETGDTEQSRLELTIGSLVQAEGGAVEGLLPPIALDLTAGPVEPKSNAHFRYPIRVTGAELAVEGVPAEAAQEAADELAVLKGLSGWVEVDARGITRDSSFTVPSDVPRDMAVMLSNVRASLMSVPLPEEPVGVGARWETERDVDVHGMTARQKVTYTLASVDEHGGMLEVAVHTSAAPHNVQGGRVHAYESGGLASVNFLFDRLTPLSEADVTSQSRATLQTPAGIANVQSRNRVALRLYNLQHGVEAQGTAAQSPTEPPAAPAQPAAAPAGDAPEAPVRPSAPAGTI